MLTRFYPRTPPLLSAPSLFHSEQSSAGFSLNLLTAMSHGGVNDPLQRSRLKIQFAFCLGIRYASHLSPVVHRIRTTRFQSILNRYLRRRWSLQPVSKRREPCAH